MRANVSPFQLNESNYCPLLEHCVSVAVELLPSDVQQFVISDIVHGLLEHFFSAQRSEYHSDDVKWLIQLSNEKFYVKRRPIRILTDNIKQGIPFGVAKHYLTRVITHAKNPEGNDVTLRGFCEEVTQCYGVLATITPWCNFIS